MRWVSLWLDLGSNVLSQTMKSLVDVKQFNLLPLKQKITNHMHPSPKLFSSSSLLASPLLHLCILFCLFFGCLIQGTNFLNKAQNHLFCTLTPTSTLLSRPQFPHLSDKLGTWRKHFYVLFSIPPFYVFLPRSP